MPLLPTSPLTHFRPREMELVGGRTGCWRKRQERKAGRWEMTPHYHKINGQWATAGAWAPMGTSLLNEMPFSKCHPSLLLV